MSDDKTHGDALRAVEEFRQKYIQRWGGYFDEELQEISFYGQPNEDVHGRSLKLLDELLAGLLGPAEAPDQSAGEKKWEWVPCPPHIWHFD